MILKHDNLWNAPAAGATLVAVTTNAYLGRQGLAMGQGAALEAKIRYPWLPSLAARVIRAEGVAMSGLQRYGWVVVAAHNVRIGLFQVKFHYGSEALISLIAYSCKRLAQWLDHHPQEIVALNFPGIGAGRLRRDQVLPVISTLSDRVWIYEQPLAKVNR